MFYINNVPILAEELTVLQELKDQLAANGVYLFKEFKKGRNNIQTCCPIHNDGQEAKPSCGISTVPQKTADRILPPGTVHCFTCGYTATLEEMISNCFGKDDFGYYGKMWLTKNFLTVSVESRKEIELDVSRSAPKKSKTIYVSEEELDKYRYTHPYMYKRKLTDELIERFDIGYDKRYVLETKPGVFARPLKCITFPVRDITGNTLFIARRSVDTKFFHYPENVNKPVYGLYELSQLQTFPEEIIVCESMFNATTCWAYGKYGVALLGTGTESQYETLKKLPCRKIITGLDPDKAGIKATERLKAALSGSKLVTSLVLPEGKDINDLTEEEFNSLDEIF